MQPGSFRPLALLALVSSIGCQPDGVVACPVIAPDESVGIVLELGTREPIELEVQWFDRPEGGICSARLQLLASRLPSLRFVPRPGELAEAVGGVAREWGATECSIHIDLVDDIAGELDPYDLCWWGEYGYDATSWWPRRPDRRCLEPTDP